MKMDIALKMADAVSQELCTLRLINEFVDSLTEKAGHGKHKEVEVHYDTLFNLGASISTCIEHIEIATSLKRLKDEDSKKS